MMRIISTTQYHQCHQRGLTLIELMISVTLGMFIVLAISSLTISSKAAQSTQYDASNIQDTARFALDNISRSVRLAGYINFDQEDGVTGNPENMTAGILGLDGSSLKRTSHGIDSPLTDSINSSDVLALRFFGSGTPADDTILNCAGFGVPAPTSPDPEQRGWSIYYVDFDVNNEPALFCKYHNGESFQAQSIANGVESFQVLYRVETSSLPDALSNPLSNTVTRQFLSATEVTALDAAIPALELNQKTHWKKITAIKVAMLIRGLESSRLDSTNATYHLFGEDYSHNLGSQDKGVQIHESDLPLAQRKRLRKIVSTTIQLRNAMD